MQNMFYIVQLCWFLSFSFSAYSYCTIIIVSKKNFLLLLNRDLLFCLGDGSSGWCPVLKTILKDLQCSVMVKPKKQCLPKSIHKHAHIIKKSAVQLCASGDILTFLERWLGSSLNHITWYYKWLRYRFQLFSIGNWDGEIGPRFGSCPY